MEGGIVEGCGGETGGYFVLLGLEEVEDFAGHAAGGFELFVGVVSAARTLHGGLHRVDWGREGGAASERGASEASRVRMSG